MPSTEDLVLTREDVMPRSPAPAEADVEIVVVAQLNLPQQSRETHGLLRRFTTVTLQTLQDLGARIHLMDVTSEEPDFELLNRSNGVLMLGGGDIDPSFYGHSGDVANEYGRDPVSDTRPLAITRWAIETDATLLAICRGSQILNVACGGTIIPDIQPSSLHHGDAGEPSFLDETLTLMPGTKVREVFGRERLTVRSGHHQAVDTVGAGLRVAAMADDGVVEGTERIDNTWIVGVQWHPEDDDGSEQDRIALFSAFLEEARSRARLTPSRG
jgi:putative glutamine amidotransferase